MEKQYRFIDNRGVAVKTVEKETGLLLFWGGFDLPESQLDRENRMGDLRPNVGETDRGERKRDNNKTQSAPLVQRGFRAETKNCKKTNKEQEPQNR